MPALGLTGCVPNRNSLGIFECISDKDQRLLLFRIFSRRLSTAHLGGGLEAVTSWDSSALLNLPS